MNRFKQAKKVSLFGIIGNLFLFIIKSIVALITHSQAMSADAINSASDIFSSLMTYIGNKIASKAPDKDHNLGHGKAEYIFSMIISLTMILLGVGILKESFTSLIINNKYNFSIWLIIVCIITIIIKFILYKYTDKVGKEQKNLLVLANAKDHRNDCLITSINLISAILSSYNIKYIDSIVGILISLWIIYTGITIFKESYDILMDKAINEETKEKVLKIIKSHPEIIKINHFNTTPVGYLYQISFTIFVDGNLSTFESHKIANDLEKEIDKKVKEIYLTIIHVNPLDLKDKNLRRNENE